MTNMIINKKFTKVVIASIGFVALSGCASLKHGTYEKIEVVTSPPGALCKIYRQGEGFLKSIASPGAKYIKRGSETIRIVCSKEGYKTVIVENTPQPINGNDMVGNLATLGAGFLFDVANESYYDLPERFEITLVRKQ